MSCEYLYRIRKIEREKGNYPKKGFVRFLRCNFSTKYCDIMAYNRKLSIVEMNKYALDFIGTNY